MVFIVIIMAWVFPVFPIFMSCHSGRGEAGVYGLAYHWQDRGTRKQEKHEKHENTQQHNETRSNK